MITKVPAFCVSVYALGREDSAVRVEVCGACGTFSRGLPAEVAKLAKLFSADPKSYRGEFADALDAHAEEIGFPSHLAPYVGAKIRG